MKKVKNSDSEVVTRKVLKQELAIFVDKIIKYVDYKIDYKLEPFKDYAKFKNSVLTNLDWLVSEVKNIKDELMILTARHPEINDKLVDHEKRINKLERKPIN